jgi:hypothetical protein
VHLNIVRDHCGRDHMVVGFTTICAISASPLKLWVRIPFMATAEQNLFKLSHIAVYDKIQVKFDYGVFHLYRSWVVALFLLENRDFLGFQMIFKVPVLYGTQQCVKVWKDLVERYFNYYPETKSVTDGRQDGRTWGSLYTSDSRRAGVSATINLKYCWKWH